MRAILIHGMGRTPLAMLILAARLRAAGFRPVLFGYSVTLETWEGCLARLEKFIGRHAAGGGFIIVGHSLGSVLTRAVLPKLTHPPVACFFLAPPTLACAAARRLAPRGVYRRLAGEMGQLLANESFMAGLPAPGVPTKVYAGTGGPVGRYSPFGDEPNDGVLAVSETRLDGAPMAQVPAIHTFIMNSRAVAADIVATVQALAGQAS
ncbi:MAG: esterase/lipase family protein [Methylomagnum sp.]